jgi:hypothetical protein
MHHFLPFALLTTRISICRLSAVICQREGCEPKLKDIGCVDRSGLVKIKTGIKDTKALFFENMVKNIYVNK